MQRYTLNQLEGLTGIKTDTIRIWESRYGILKPSRTVTGRRYYSDSDLAHLLNISLLYRKGHRISSIASMSAPEVASRAAEAAAASFEPDAFIDSLIVSMTRLDERSVNEVLYNSVIRLGFEDAFTGVVFPFLRRVGILWHTGSANIAAEHFITNIIRGHLLAAVDGIKTRPGEAGKKVLMFLPEGEYHELNLLFYRYLVRKRGHEVLYLGQSTPVSALEEVSKIWKPDVVVTGMLSGWPALSPAEYLRLLNAVFPYSAILAGGLLYEQAAASGISAIHGLNSEADLSAYL